MVRGTYGLNLCGLNPVGRATMCGVTGALAIGLPATAGAARVVVPRGEGFCMVALIACPEAPLMPGKTAAIKKSTEN